MPGIKELKNRIKSIKSTRKITKAMQMVSAAKMRKAQVAALNSRKYSDLAWELIESLGGMANIGDELPSLLKTFPKATKTGIIVISTNKGLVGSFNTNLMNKQHQLEISEKGVIAELLVMGKKAKDFAVRYNKRMMADFPKKDVWTPITDIYPLAQMVSKLYASGEYKTIYIIYNKFVSTLVQQATIKQLLPFEKRDEGLGSRGETADFLFEPSPELVLNNILPRIIESQIYQAVLESDASEHSARMVMMKNATEAAGDLIADYTLTYNQLRQNKITTELAEITAGRIALE